MEYKIGDVVGHRGRGIKVCPEWDFDYLAFREWALAKRLLEIDRIDGDKDYSPDNCRWVTHEENMRNMRERG